MAYHPGAGVPVPPPGHPALARVGPIEPWYRRSWVRLVLLIVGLCLMGVCGLLIYGYLGYSLGPVAFVVAAAAAIVPVPILVACFWWLDRYEPEPWQFLALAFVWGACVATVAALIVNTVGGRVISEVGGTESTTGVFVAPPTEEFFKALPLFVLLVVTFVGRRLINGVVDGIVYAGMSAVGFAFTENILYFGSQYAEASKDGDSRQGLAALFAIFVARGIFSPFAHPLFTCMTGIGVGIAARNRHTWVRIVAPIGGLAVAVLLHGTWNLLASSGDFSVILLGYGLIMVPAFLAMVTVAIVIRHREARVIGSTLPEYGRLGWFTPQEIASLRTIRGRRAARIWARQLSGPTGGRAMTEYQFAATKLAMLRDALARGLGRSDYRTEEQDLLQTLGARRLWIVQNARRPLQGAPLAFPGGGWTPSGPAAAPRPPGAPVAAAPRPGGTPPGPVPPYGRPDPWSRPGH